MKPRQKLPKSVQATLWSYDLNRLDLEQHKRIIISQILNFGTEDATHWLFQQYEKNEIETEANQIPLGQWDKKSLSLWSLVLKLKPVAKTEKLAKL